MLWHRFVDMMNLIISTHVWSILNLSDGQKVAKTLFKSTIYYNSNVKQSDFRKNAET